MAKPTAATMTRMAQFAAACVAALAVISSATSIPITEHADFGPSEAAAKRNGFEIFNAIHSAMRQWGSSLNHNGMSFYLATIPAGVTLHHGTHSPNPPTGPEWLAFEIEHAEQFAHPRRRPGSGPLPPPPGETPPGGAPPPPFTAQHPFHIDQDHSHPPPPRDHHHPSPPPDHHRDHHPKPAPNTHPSSSSPSDDNDDDTQGYLQTYLTTTPLHLLYLDGTSAGNTDMGTLDTQDFILRLNRSAPIWDERGRAQELCNIATSWGLHGVVRMEAGFEVIKCDFGVGMRLVSANRRWGFKDGRPGEGGGEGEEGEVRVFEFVKAVAGRYHGIGGRRVKVDWGSMVSAFFYDEVDLGDPDADGKKGMPRLVGLSDGELRAIRGRVEEVVKERREGRKEAVDWQGVVDLVVARYADRLRYMAEGDVSIGVMRAEVNGLLDTHIDYSTEDKEYEAAMGRCARFYTLGVVPMTQEDHLIKAAIETVTHSICSTLFEARKLVVEDSEAWNESLQQARGLLRDLMGRLRWTRWKECAACGFDEVCFVPMWPFGDKASYERPSCRNATSLRNGWWDNGYWQPGPGGRHRTKVTDEGPRDL